MVLYINACVRAESRTDRLARALLGTLGAYEEVNLQEKGLLPLNAERLAQRADLLAKQEFSAPAFQYARQFAAADTIVVSAPFWDGSFPSALKVYFENVYAIGIVTKYREDGTPVGLCKAKKLFYVTTAGGKYLPDFSYEYVRHLTVRMFGVKETELIAAENLDLLGNDGEEILEKTIRKYGWKHW